MTAAVIGALLAVAAGLVVVRSGAPLARHVAWLLAVGFGVAAIAPPSVAWHEVAAAPAAADIGGAKASARTAAASKALAASPRAVDLVLQWRAPLPALGSGLGAVATAPVPLPLQPDELQVRALTAPARDRPLALQVEASALDAPLDAEIVVRAGADVVHTQAVRLETGGAAPVVQWTPARVGPHTIEFVVAVTGHRIVATGELVVAEPARVLVLDPSGVAAAALRAQGVHVVEANAPPADFREFAAIVVGQALAADAQAALVAAVNDGAGVFVLAPGFGAPGEPLRELLPLRPRPQPAAGEGAGAAGGAEAPPGPPRNDPPDTQPPPKPPDEAPRGETPANAPVAPEPIEVDKRAIAMVLVVDRSGSMGTPLADGNTKMSYAKTSALQTARALGPGDEVAIVTFGNKDDPRVELPLTDATATDAVRAGIARLAHAGEMTFLLGGLRSARGLLAPSKAAVKHVVVISDGEVHQSESLALRALAHRMRTEDHVTVSMISIVDAYTDQSFMREAELLTRDGGGQFLPVSEPGNVPALVSAEVTRSLQRVGRKPRGGDGSDEPTPDAPPRPAPPKPEPPKPESPPPAKHEDTDTRVPVRAVAESPLLLPLPDDAWPSLGSAVAGTAPLDARVLLVAGSEGWPLLAFGNRGLGRAGAFAADLGGAASAEFRAEAPFPARFAQWIEAVLPAQPAVAPSPLLQRASVEPQAATPRDIAVLAAFGGEPPVADGPDIAAPPPLIERRLVAVAPDWSPWLVAGTLLLALCERLLAARALRRGRAA